MVAYMVFAEGVLVGVWGLPDSPEGLYGLSFSTCIVIFFSSRFITTVSISLIPSFAHIWSAPKAVYDRARCAVSKTWRYVLGIEREG